VFASGFQITHFLKGRTMIATSLSPRFPMRHWLASAAAWGVLSVLGGTAMLPASSALAAAPMIKTQAPGYYRMMLGDFEVTALSDGTATIPLAKLLTHTAPGEAEQLLKQASLDPQHVETSINAFLVNTGKQLVLIDTGAGEVFGGKQSGKIVSSLKAAGYKPEDIDAVLLTHIHADHSGGLTVQGKAVFPNALVYADKHEEGFWLDPATEGKLPAHQKHGVAEAASALAPYIAAGKLRSFDGNAEIFPGIRSVALPGHTPGHSLYAIESQGQKLMVWGDLIHAKDVQFQAPGITIQFDVDAEAAASQRQKALAEAQRQGYLVAAVHIPFPGIGHVAASGSSYRWVPVNYSLAGLQFAGDAR
jgi:glyoxylase-like metal-dependent hydrolase (beta-lactamase superfamily II)